jgi:hypothetical protein
MPAESQAEFGLMGARCAGKATKMTGMSQAQACEFIRGQHGVSSLPKRKSKLSDAIEHRKRRKRGH